MNKVFLAILCASVLACVAGGNGGVADFPYFLWDGTIQYATPASETGNSIALDTNGYIYIAGDAHLSDIYGNEPLILKLSQSGDLLWSKRFGVYGSANGIALGPDSIYVAGVVQGSYLGSEYGGGDDAFLIKYDPYGNVIWYKQHSTMGYTTLNDVAVDPSGDVYVAGEGGEGFTDVLQIFGTGTNFITKFDSSGNGLWTYQFGDNYNTDAVRLLIDHSGDIVVAGTFSGSIAGLPARSSYDVFVIKFAPNGGFRWINTYGSNSDDAQPDIAVDPSGNIYLVAVGGSDILYIKLDRNGNEIFSDRFGSTLIDSYPHIAVDASRNVHITARVDFKKINLITYVGGDILYRKYDESGGLLHTGQFGTTETDTPGGLAVGEDGSAYIEVHSSGSLDGMQNIGGTDIYVVKFDPEGNKL